MKPVNQDMSCAIICLLIAGLTGILAFALLLLLAGFIFLQAMMVSGLIFLVAWGFLIYAFCRALPVFGDTLPGSRGTGASHFAGGGPATAALQAAPMPVASEPSVVADAGSGAEPAPLPQASEAMAVAAVGSPEPATARFAGVSADPSAPAPEGASTMAKPAMLSGPRGDKPDDLKIIRGIGPKLELVLHRMGVYHFSQIAEWHAAELAWVDSNLEGFRGRASRDHWVVQARVLAHGGTEAEAFAAADAAEG